MSISLSLSIYIYIHTHTCIHIYIYIYTHILTQRRGGAVGRRPGRAPHVPGLSNNHHINNDMYYELYYHYEC